MRPSSKSENFSLINDAYKNSRALNKIEDNTFKNHVNNINNLLTVICSPLSNFSNVNQLINLSNSYYSSKEKQSKGINKIKNKVGKINLESEYISTEMGIKNEAVAPIQSKKYTQKLKKVNSSLDPKSNKSNSTFFKILNNNAVEISKGSSINFDDEAVNFKKLNFDMKTSNKLGYLNFNNQLKAKYKSNNKFDNILNEKPQIPNSILKMSKNKILYPSNNIQTDNLNRDDTSDNSSVIVKQQAEKVKNLVLLGKLNQIKKNKLKKNLSESISVLENTQNINEMSSIVNHTINEKESSITDKSIISFKQNKTKKTYKSKFATFKLKFSNKPKIPIISDNKIRRSNNMNIMGNNFEDLFDKQKLKLKLIKKQNFESTLPAKNTSLKTFSSIVFKKANSIKSIDSSIVKKYQEISSRKSISSEKTNPVNLKKTVLYKRDKYVPTKQILDKLNVDLEKNGFKNEDTILIPNSKIGNSKYSTKLKSREELEVLGLLKKEKFSKMNQIVIRSFDLNNYEKINEYHKQDNAILNKNEFTDLRLKSYSKNDKTRNEYLNLYIKYLNKNGKLNKVVKNRQIKANKKKKRIAQLSKLKFLLNKKKENEKERKNSFSSKKTIKTKYSKKVHSVSSKNIKNDSTPIFNNSEYMLDKFTKNNSSIKSNMKTSVQFHLFSKDDKENTCNKTTAFHSKTNSYYGVENKKDNIDSCIALNKNQSSNKDKSNFEKSSQISFYDKIKLPIKLEDLAFETKDLNMIKSNKSIKKKSKSKKYKSNLYVPQKCTEKKLFPKANILNDNKIENLKTFNNQIEKIVQAKPKKIKKTKKFKFPDLDNENKHYKSKLDLYYLLSKAMNYHKFTKNYEFNGEEINISKPNLAILTRDMFSESEFKKEIGKISNLNDDVVLNFKQMFDKKYNLDSNSIIKEKNIKMINTEKKFVDHVNQMRKESENHKVCSLNLKKKLNEYIEKIKK